MKIEHIAIWSPDIERLRDFYIRYFEAESNDLYGETDKGFKSFFLTFESGARLEIMSMGGILSLEESEKQYLGYCHLAISVGSMFEVIKLTQHIKDDGYQVIGEPRTTGDGYFESVVLDPDGNRIEITQ